ncbi:LOW QUALITY PROTEIN: Hypothetical protein PHPALM_13813 [Phytophthora palmivora]|uniref:Uncharacterized protein n=1 Tax=Phytophthora palmivora TaxID=4796 RepID=A0A2P4XWD1_9STRA|nr:LOW QUALITY PROTEIN: Hypothetical protein PHPALM_13813 [Phytophthora palmivora]
MDTKQGAEFGGAVVVDSDQGNDSDDVIQVHIEQGTEFDGAVSMDTKPNHTVSLSGDGEIRYFCEEPKAVEDQDVIAAIDRDDVMSAIGFVYPLFSDEGNIVSESFSISDESEDDDYAIYKFDLDFDKYVDNVKSDSEYDDDAELKLDGPPLYSGRWGPAKSAAAFADPPIGMLVYFLPLTLCHKIAAESEASRKERFPAIAQKTRQLLLAAEVKNPKKSVYDLENIINRLERKKPNKGYFGIANTMFWLS